jgi:co-chaperonin GroES (HSP10)
MSAISGQKTVTAAGTAEALGTAGIHGPLMVKALDTNTGIVAVGNDGNGDVTTSNGLRLAAGDVVVFDHVSQLSALYVDSAVNGEGVSWISLSV